MKKKDVAIVFPTGRKSVVDVVSMLTKNLEANGHPELYNFHLILSYDPTFYGLTRPDFEIEASDTKSFASVTYLGPESVEDLIPLVEGAKVEETDFKTLFEPRGYCSQKNRAIIAALKRGVEHVVFLDDDEYFVAPFRTESGLTWEEQDVVGTHLELNSAAAITNGCHTGYFSPIPSDLELKLEESVRQMLGQVLAIGNEVITERTFLGTRECVAYGDRERIAELPEDIPEVKGVRSLNGGNITLNASAVRKGIIPPYFNPPGARGEDAILGMQIKHLKALRVPTYTFHDPFQKYIGMTQGTYPDSIDAIKVIPGTIDRFCKACVGWVKYAPFLIRLTSRNEGEYQVRVERMASQIGTIGKEIDRQLGWNGFGQMLPTLREYDSRSKGDVQDLISAKSAWQRIVRNV